MSCFFAELLDNLEFHYYTSFILVVCLAVFCIQTSCIPLDELVESFSRHLFSSEAVILVFLTLYHNREVC